MPHRSRNRRGIEPLLAQGSSPWFRKLDSPIEDLVVGGGGRYLCLKLEGPELAVFDVNAADVIKTIKLDSDNVLIAAGAESLVVACQDHVPGTVQRWSFADLSADATKVALPIRGRIKALAMGSDSDGPLVVVWAPYIDLRSAAEARFSFLDPQTFAVLKAGSMTDLRFTQWDLSPWAGISPSGGSIVMDTDSYLPVFHDRHPSQEALKAQVRVRASAGGNLYGMWGSAHGIPQILAIRGAGLQWSSNSALRRRPQILPGPDGRTVYIDRRAIQDIDSKPVWPVEKCSSASMIAIPSTDPGYFLGVESDHAVVHGTNPGGPLFSVLDLDEMAAGGIEPSGIPSDFTIEKRYHLIPAAKMLITIPYTNDRLVLRRLDIEKAAANAGCRVARPPLVFALPKEPMLTAIPSASSR